MLPPSPLTDPYVQHSRIRFFTGEIRFSVGIAVDKPGRRQRVAGEEPVEAVPREPLRARASRQPLVPYLRDLVAILLQSARVPRDAVVGVVTDEFGRQPGELIEDRPMPIGSAPVLNHGQRAGKAAFGRRLPHHVLAVPRLSPGVGEPRKSNGGSLQSACVPPPRCGRKSMKRVLSGCSVSPNRPRRFSNTSNTRLASWWVSKVITKSSANRTRVAVPIRRGRTSPSNHLSSTWCR